MMYSRENFKKDPLLVIEALVVTAGVAVFLLLLADADSGNVGGLGLLYYFAIMVVISGIIVSVLTLTSGIRKLRDYPRGKKPSSEQTQPGVDF